MSNPRILVVEDNPITRKLARVSLEGENYVVVEAADAATAVELMARAAPDAVMLDSRLPRCESSALASRLREMSGNRKVPILAFCGFVSNGKSLEEDLRGFDDVLPTPLEPNALPRVLRSHLARPSPATAGEGRQILVVDDNAIQAKLLKIQLSGLGFRVNTARDGHEALALARKHPPDAIMSDVLMPNVDGFSLCLAVREDPLLQHLPIVLLSSCDGEDSRKIARDVGANAFVERNGDESRAVGALLEAVSGPSSIGSVRSSDSVAPTLGRWTAKQTGPGASANSRMAEQCAMQAVQLAVLGSIAESLASSADTGGTLHAAFRQCLDACGIPRGALFLANALGRLRCESHHGYSDAEVLDLGEWFPGSEPARSASKGEVRTLSRRAGASDARTSGLVLPLVTGGRTLGVLLVESQDRKLTDPEVFGFIRMVSLELAHALGLGAACATLAASEQRYRALMGSANDAIFIRTLGGKILEANRHAEELIGRPLHAIVNCDFNDLVIEDATPALFARSSRVSGTIERSDRTLLVESSSAVIDTVDGELVISVVRDVSEQRRMEDELRKSEQKYRSLLETSPDIYWSTDGAGSTEYLSPNVERITGFTSEELRTGGPSFWLGRVDQRHVGMVEQAYTEVMALGMPMNVEYRFQRKDERWIWLHGRSYFQSSEDGRLRVHVVTSEVTQRKVLEQHEAVRYAITRAIAESRDPAQVMHDILPPWCEMLGWDAGRVWLCDEGSKTLRLEAGFAPEQAWFGPLVEVFSPPAPSEAAARAFRTGEITWIDELELQTGLELRGGLAFPLLWENRVLGVIDCFTVERRADCPELAKLARDVGNQLGTLLQRKRAEAELRRIEEQLRQAQKMEAIGQLAGGIAHDFNNLLSIVLMTSSALLDDLAPGDPRREELEEIRGASERAAELTRRLLTFSRKNVIEPVSIDLGTTVAGVEKILQRVLGADIELITNTASDLGSVLADTGQIEQVLLNLAVNARDAMPNGGTLTIETANVDLDQEFAGSHAGVEPGSYVALIVSDTGCGMDDEIKRRIFEPFFTTKEVGRGTGLGLATVYGIVKQAGRSVWVYSEPGHGSAFKISLPRLDGERPREGAANPREELRGTETLLVVDDQEKLRGLMARALESLGYTVLAAADADEALTIAKSFDGRIDAIITDVVMPKVSGPELAHQLAAVCPEARVLYVSGYTDHANVRERLLQPASKMLQKPFSTAALGNKVRELFAVEQTSKP
jgi:PAS domain S-box-containing protein